MQNTKRIWASVLALVAVSLAVPAAGEDGGYARRGLYVGAGGAYVLEQFDLPSATVSSGGAPPVHLDVDSGDSWGAEARVGYRFHPNVAAEGQLQYYDEFGLDLHVSPGSSGQVATLDGMSLMGNVKGYPLTGRVQPYVLGGLGLLWLQLEDAVGAGLTDNEVGFAGHVGVGVDAYLTDNLLLNLEASYLLPAGDLNDFRMIPISLGMQYRFD
jgi:opacity protein-like surface antigen